MRPPLFSPPSNFQVLVEPRYSLQKSLFFGESLGLDAQVTSNSKTVRNARKQVDLIRLLCLDQNLLRLVTFFHRKYRINLRSCNGKRSRDSSKLILLYRGWMGDVTAINSTFLQIANDVLRLLLIVIQVHMSQKQLTLAPKQ